MIRVPPGAGIGRDRAGRVGRRDVLAGLTGVATVALAGCEQVLLEDDDFPDGTPPDPLKERAGTFVERVENGEYDAATDPFTAEMESGLPPDRLASTWADTVGHLGEFQEISRWGYDTAEGNDLVFARVRRAEGYYDLQVTFTPDRQIAGVFVNDVSG